MLYFADSLKLLYPKFHNSLIAILSENEIEFDAEFPTEAGNEVEFFATTSWDCVSF